MKLIITFKVQTVRIQRFKGFHPKYYLLVESKAWALSINVTSSSSRNPGWSSYKKWFWRNCCLQLSMLPLAACLTSVLYLFHLLLNLSTVLPVYGLPYVLQLSKYMRQLLLQLKLWLILHADLVTKLENVSVTCILVHTWHLELSHL